MSLKKAFAAAAVTLLLASAASATPIKVDLRPIPDSLPHIWGAASIECGMITGTGYIISVHNLPLNEFQVVLVNAQREERMIGTFEVTARKSETVAQFVIPMTCPVGQYDQILIRQGTRQVLFGDLPETP